MALRITLPDADLSAELLERYSVQQKIGEGAYSSVRRIVERSTGDEYALKVVDLRPLRLSRSFDRSRLLREVNIMKTLKPHPNVMRLHNIFETEDKLMMVVELVKGGELFTRILDSGPFPEAEARPVIKQVLEALAFLHDQGIIHRDIKPENIMLQYDTPTPSSAAAAASASSGGSTSTSTSGSAAVKRVPTVKLVDFGLAKMLGENHSLARTFVGTPQYFSPEVLKAAKDPSMDYGAEVDCWSVGVVLFLMISGRYPFDGSHAVEGRESLIRHGRFRFDPAQWSGVSTACRHLVAGLLTVDRSRRLSVRDALQHPWFTGKGVEALEDPRPPPPLTEAQARAQQQAEGITSLSASSSTSATVVAGSGSGSGGGGGAGGGAGVGVGVGVNTGVDVANGSGRTASLGASGGAGSSGGGGGGGGGEEGEGGTPKRGRSQVDEDSGVIMHRTDSTGLLTYVSQAWERYLGYSYEQVVGTPVAALLTPRSRRRATRDIFPAVRNVTGSARDVRLRFQRGGSASGVATARLSLLVNRGVPTVSSDNEGGGYEEGKVLGITAVLSPAGGTGASPRSPSAGATKGADGSSSSSRAVAASGSVTASARGNAAATPDPSSPAPSAMATAARIAERSASASAVAAPARRKRARSGSGGGSEGSDGGGSAGAVVEGAADGASAARTGSARNVRQRTWAGGELTPTTPSTSRVGGGGGGGGGSGSDGGGAGGLTPRSQAVDAPDMVVHSIDQKGRLTAVNDAWCALLGYSRAEVIGRRSVEFLTPQSAQYATQIILPQFMKTGKCKNVEYDFVHRSGRLVRVLLTATSEKDAAGSMVRSIAVIVPVVAEPGEEAPTVASVTAAAGTGTERRQADNGVTDNSAVSHSNRGSNSNSNSNSSRRGSALAMTTTPSSTVSDLAVSGNRVPGRARDGSGDGDEKRAGRDRAHTIC